MGKYRGSRGTGLYDAILAGVVVEQHSAPGTLSKNVTSLVQNSTADVGVAVTLPVPLMGSRADIACIAFTTSTAAGAGVKVKANAGASIGPSSSIDVITFGAANQAVSLVALNSTKWYVTKISSGVTLTNTT